MTVVPRGPQDGNRQPNGSGNGAVSDHRFARPELPPTLFRLTDLTVGQATPPTIHPRPASTAAPSAAPAVTRGVAPPANATTNRTTATAPTFSPAAHPAPPTGSQPSSGQPTGVATKGLFAKPAPAAPPAAAHSLDFQELSADEVQFQELPADKPSPAATAPVAPAAGEDTAAGWSKAVESDKTPASESAKLPNVSERRSPTYEQPAGRTWMETISANRTVLLLLLLVIAAAVITARRSSEPNEIEAALAETGEQLKFDAGDLDLGAEMGFDDPELSTAFAAATSMEPTAGSDVANQTAAGKASGPTAGDVARTAAGNVTTDAASGTQSAMGLTGPASSGSTTTPQLDANGGGPQTATADPSSTQPVVSLNQPLADVASDAGSVDAATDHANSVFGDATGEFFGGASKFNATPVSSRSAAKPAGEEESIHTPYSSGLPTLEDLAADTPDVAAAATQNTATQNTATQNTATQNTAAPFSAMSVGPTGDAETPAVATDSVATEISASATAALPPAVKYSKTPIGINDWTPFLPAEITAPTPAADLPTSSN